MIKIAGYQPLHIQGNEVGLVQSRQNFLLPNDAYPTLVNAYIWRERIKRKQGFQLLGRLQRNFTTLSLGNSFASPWTINTIFSTLAPPIVPEANATIVVGSVVIVIGAITFTDQGDGTLTSLTPGNSGTINYITAVVVLTHTAGAGIPTTISFSYYPNLPVMGIKTRERPTPTNDQTVFFNTKYAFIYSSVLQSFDEFLPGTTWQGQDFNFFWTTNYFVGDDNNKIFWATNYSSSPVDQIKYTNGVAATNWVNFEPIIDSAGNKLWQCLAMLPFRGRLVAFNTSEGKPIPGLRYTNRIRWSAIGTPFTVPSAIVTTVNPDAWLDDKRGQGGFLDIPTNEDIVSVGFVRDNLVIYCQNSTWQLRYTGRSIAPFQIEKVNSEIGSTSTFSSIQFDTSLFCMGNRGIVECDSFKSSLIDIKIPDFVYNLQGNNHGLERIQGIRDFINRLAYWTFCSESSDGSYPDGRLVYNYENASWAIFTDSLTALGTFQEGSSRNWLNTHIPWVQCNFNWLQQPSFDPLIVGGNQQGFIEILDQQTTNDPSLYIYAITTQVNDATIITSPSHNLTTNTVIMITNIPTGTPFASDLNGNVYEIVLGDATGSDTANQFRIFSYDPNTGEFSNPQISTDSGYIGGGLISVRDNFNITSKKFNFIEEGQNIQMGYLDILMNAVPNGAISMNVFLDYNDNQAMNTPSQNTIEDGTSLFPPDTFFNSIIPTSQSTLNNNASSKFWQRIICPIRGNFITIQYLFNNAQMAGNEQRFDVQIDAQVLWIRRAGRMTQG